MIETPDRPNEDNGKAQVDLSRSASLDGWLLAVAVHVDGEQLWLMREDGAGRPGCACAECAPHDQLGAWVADRKDAAR